MTESHEVAKHIGDAAALVVAVATLIEWLPALAAALSIVWTAIRIYETKTVQALITRWRKRDDNRCDP